MSNRCKKSNTKLDELRQKLKDFVTTVEPGSKDYKNKLDLLRLEYTGPGGSISAETFQQALQEVSVDNSIISDKRKSCVLQLQNPSLDYNNMSVLYRNANTALGFMRHDFNTRMFKALFLDNTNYGDKVDQRGRLINDTITRIPLTALDVNKNISNLKNDLINLVANEFEIEINSPIFSYGNNANINSENYVKILNDPKVTSWLAKVNPNLQTADTHTMQIHSALVMLNNFDTLVTKYLPKILTVSKDAKGQVTNTIYTKEFEGNAPSIWSADDLVTYGSDLYASNLGKFILGTINKVDADLNPIEGAYMESQDAFVLASLLREAEYEYHILKRDTEGYPYNPNLAFKNDLGEAIRVLLKMGVNDELDTLKRFKKEIFPVYNWLYNTNESTIATSDIYANLFKSGQIKNVASVLNLSSVLAGEIIKNAVPVYLETTTFDAKNYKRPIRTINLSHTFRGTGYLTQNLKGAIFNELQIDAKDQNKILNGKISRNVFDNLSMNDILASTNDDAKALLDAFELLFNLPLSKGVIQGMKVGKEETAKNRILDVIFKIGELFRNTSQVQEDERESYFGQNFDSVFLQASSDFKSKYTTIVQAVADRKTDSPITIIKNAEGKSIPIYRLGSTIFDDAYLLGQLKKTHQNRDTMNLFLSNPHLLSNINNPTVKQGEAINHNNAYQGSTGLRLETISQKAVNAANNSSGKEAFINSFFGDFVGLGTDPDGNSISVQLMTLSDKSSILTKIINLDGIITGYGRDRYGKPAVVLNKSLDRMSNDEIQGLYYYYRKNQIVDEMFHIIGTWNKVLGLNLVEPNLNEELINAGQMLDTTAQYIRQSWQTIKQTLSTHDTGKKADYIEELLRNYIQQHPEDKDISLIKDLHYSFYKNATTLNKNIYFHFKQVVTKQAFNDQIERYISSNLRHPWYISLQKLANTTEGQELLKAYSAQHGFTFVEKSGVSRDILQRKIILDALFRSQLMDLHFKGAHLDAIKNISNHEEVTDNDIITKDDILEADAKFKAAGKRTVDLGGTKQNFAQGLIDGVSAEVNVAHIEEPTEEVWSPSGIVEAGLEILNGSGRISYIYAMMESASMTGNPFRGINRKTLGEGIGDYSSTLYKWAEYLINNWHMRNSLRSTYNLQDLFRKMHNIEFGENIDLTKTFLNPDSLFTPLQANDGQKVFFATGAHYYQLTRLTNIGENLYDITLKEVNEYGEELIDPNIIVPTKAVPITNLYELFQVLGGVESMSLNESGKLEYSNASLKMLYNYVVNVGTVQNPDYKDLNQAVVRQPLRDKFIAIVASNSGIKRGETNTNGKAVYTDPNKSLLISKVKTAEFGAQMDVYHHIDNESEATEPTQTLAALATNGNTREEANKVYNAIATIIRSNMRDIARTNNIEYNSITADKVIKDLTKDIISTINDNGSDLQNSLVELCQTYLSGLIPLSDATFYNAFHSYNIQQLNQLALRRKYSGMGNTLNPSSDSYQLFTIGESKSQLQYEDLIKRARQNFGESPIVQQFNTRQLVNLYLLSESDFGKSTLSNGIDSFGPEAINVVNQLIQAIDDNMNIKSGQIVSQDIFKACAKKISKGEMEALDTIFYMKNGNVYKQSLTTAKSFFEIINDPDITQVYLDITTPHDLKPEIVKYTYNGETHQLADSEAGELSYLMNNFSTNDFEEALDSLIEEGNQENQKCSI